MINKPHSLRLGKSSSVAAGNEGHAQAVEASVNTELLKIFVDASVFITGKDARKLNTILRKFYKTWLKRWVKRNGKVLPWIVLASLCVSQAYGSVNEVDVFHWDRTLAKPASSVESDFKSYSHPFGLGFQSFSKFPNFIIRQLRLDPVGCSTDSEPCQWVSLGVAHPNRFVHQLRKEFEFKESRIVANLATVDMGCSSPCDVLPTVAVLDLSGMNDPFNGQKSFYGLPCDLVPLLRVAVPPMSLDIRWYPCLECWACSWCAYPSLLGTGFIGQPLSLASIFGGVCSKPGRFLYPFASIKVAPFQEPVRGAWMGTNRCHMEEVSPRTDQLKQNPLVYLSLARTRLAQLKLTLSTITPQGTTLS